MIKSFFFQLLVVLLLVSASTPILSNSQDQTDPDSSLFTVIGVGDIMFGTHFPNRNYLPPKNDCAPLLEPVKHILSDAHVTFGNLEGCFLDEGKVAKKCKDTTICYAFKMPSKYVDCLTESGFDVVSLANNHIGDFGDTGRLNTIQLLDSAGIHFGGLLTNPTSIFEKNGLKIGFCAFSPNTGTCSITDTSNAKRIVSELNKQCDIVIVSFHGGAEGANYKHITRKKEEFYGENRGNVYEFARHVIDAGADIVFGHGPHVTRAFDLYKGRFIAYSLGNFCTYSRFNLQGPNGFAPIVKLYIEKNGKFVKGNIFPIIQVGEGGPVLDTENRVISEIQQLTASDFPDSPIFIENDGSIHVK